LEESQEARKALKDHYANFEAKTIQMEEEMFEMENTMLELVNQLKEVELQNQNMEDQINTLLIANEKLEQDFNDLQKK